MPKDPASKAQVKLAAGIPFISRKDLRTQLDKAGAPTKTADAILKGEHNRSHRRTAHVIVALLAGIALIALFASRPIPAQQPSARPTSKGAAWRQSRIATSALALERSGSTCVPRFPAGPCPAKMPCLPWPSVSRARPSTT